MIYRETKTSPKAYNVSRDYNNFHLDNPAAEKRSSPREQQHLTNACNLIIKCTSISQRYSEWIVTDVQIDRNTDSLDIFHTIVQQYGSENLN